MRNSLVFHDGDKMTTLLVHSSPALGAWWVGWAGGWGAGGGVMAGQWNRLLCVLQELVKAVGVVAATFRMCSSFCPQFACAALHLLRRCMRWHPRAQWTAGMTVQQLADFNTASWFDMAARPALLSIVWVAVYYLLVSAGSSKCITALAGLGLHA